MYWREYRQRVLDAVGEKAAVRKTRQLIVERLEPKLFQRVVERPASGMDSRTRPVSRNKTSTARILATGRGQCGCAPNPG